MALLQNTGNTLNEILFQFIKNNSVIFVFYQADKRTSVQRNQYEYYRLISKTGVKYLLFSSNFELLAHVSKAYAHKKS